MHVTCACIPITISYASRYHVLPPWIDKYLCISFFNRNERPWAREMPIICGLQIPIGCVTLVSITPTIVSICYGHLNSASLQNTCIWYRYHFQLGTNSDSILLRLYTQRNKGSSQVPLMFFLSSKRFQTKNSSL